MLADPVSPVVEEVPTGEIKSGKNTPLKGQQVYSPKQTFTFKLICSECSVYLGVLSNSSPSLFPHPYNSHHLCYFIYRHSQSKAAPFSLKDEPQVPFEGKFLPTLSSDTEDTTSNMPVCALQNTHKRSLLV